MKQSVNGIKNFWWLPLAILFIACLVGCSIVGEYMDFHFSYYMTQYSPIGPVAQYAGSVPGYALVGFVGPLLFIGLRNSQNKLLKYLGFAGLFVVPFVSGLVYGYDVFYDALKIPGLLIGAAIILAIDGLLAFLFWKVDEKDAIRDAFIIAIAFSLTFITVFLLKHIIERPRPYYVEDYYQFVPFLHFSTHVNGFTTDALESFPSGHSAIAATFLLCPLLCKYHEKTKKLEALFFVIAAVWLLFTMFGRMAGMHHYLSDVCSGALIGIFFSFLTNFIAQFIKPKKKDEAENG